MAAAALLFVVGSLALNTYGETLIQALQERDIIVREPSFIWILALIPLLLVLRATSLTDLPKTQQVTSFLLWIKYKPLISADEGIYVYRTFLRGHSDQSNL